ncbi:MAG TPA: hypothetical protein VLB46_01065 [Pyrinomonadaceae bacterium]|nr:hypothetical protein [Pyrinomonadaceae bacterium]
MNKNLGLLLLIGLFVLTGCKKWQIEADLKRLSAQQGTSQQELNRFDNAISSLRDEASQVEAQIRTRNSQTGAYLKNHVLAVTCMAAVGYSVGKDNLFSDEVNDMINAGTFVCVAAAILSEDFRNEVAQVVGTLERTSKEIKGLQNELASVRSKLAAELEARAAEQKRYDDLAQKIRSLRAELAKN